MRYSWIGAAVLVVSVLAVHSWTSAVPQAAAGPQWEYRVICEQTPKDATLQGARDQVTQNLNRNSAEGWELVNFQLMEILPPQAIENGAKGFPAVYVRYTAVFKRPKAR